MVMGVVNVTPDSFYDGGRFLDAPAAVEQALAHERDGADMVDVGGESTRPGSDPVPADEELKRVIPVIEALKARLSIPVSIDTCKARVAREAVAAGASVINDIGGLGLDPEMAPAAAELGVPVIIMHIRGRPKTMQDAPFYGDAAAEVADELRDSVERAEKAGVDPGKVWIDPGIGFAKRPEDNLALLRSIAVLKRIGRPVLIGTSRKSFIGKVLDLPTGERLEGTLASISVAVFQGADAVRVHDVKQAVRAVRVAESIREATLTPRSP